jgi:hypothetical protein
VCGAPAAARTVFPMSPRKTRAAAGSATTAALRYDRTAIIHTPHTARSTPATFPASRPFGTAFSSSTNTVMMAIHYMFITPATNNSAIRNQ